LADQELLGGHVGRRLGVQPGRLHQAQEVRWYVALLIPCMFGMMLAKSLTENSKQWMTFGLAQGGHGQVRDKQDTPGRERLRQRRGHRAARLRHLRSSLRQFVPTGNNLYEIKKLVDTSATMVVLFCAHLEFCIQWWKRLIRPTYSIGL
jgi:hypothetical protein